MNDRVEFGASSGIPEDNVAENTPIDSSVGSEDLMSEGFYDSRVHILSRVEKLVRDPIGVDQAAAEIDEHLTDGALA
jgi:hypothetical protein